MEVWISLLLTMIGSFAASSGFWAYIIKKNDLKGATGNLLLGLARSQIVQLGMMYLERGWVSKDEYDDFVKYLYEPYIRFGGNGLAERIMRDVANLPFIDPNPFLKKD